LERLCAKVRDLEFVAKEIITKYDSDTLGFHMVSSLGNHRYDVIAGARLAGLEVCEEGR